MIDLWTGTPGSGKSLHMAHQIKDDLRWGKNVISTSAIDTKLCFMSGFAEWLFNLTKGKIRLYKPDKREHNFHYIDIKDITPDYLYEFAARHHKFGKEHQTIVYLDECVAIFSPTVLTEKVWNEWDTFFRKHRHIGYDVVLIPQSPRLISRKVKEYAEHEVKHYNRKNHGLFGLFLSLVLGSLFSYSVCWRGTREAPLSQGFFMYKPLYGQMYNSYCMFDETLLPYKEAYKKKQEAATALCLALIERRKQLENEKSDSSDRCLADIYVDCDHSH